MPRRDEDSDDRPLRRPARQRQDEEDDDRPRRRRHEEEDDEDTSSDRPPNYVKIISITFFATALVVVLVGSIIAVILSRDDTAKAPEQVANGGANPVVDKVPNQVDTERNGELRAPENPEIILSNFRRNEEEKEILEFDYQSPHLRGDEYFTVVTRPGTSPSIFGVRGFLDEKGMLNIRTPGVRSFPSGTTLYICKKTGARVGIHPKPISNILTLD
jgi:hypothetical protein